ncbi:glutathione S-transferase family protein [Cupriavidus consociatus]|uniref:glutathione S-transferase family protein n=1 Tax=Cupriavidus consociatus TaxID=2821357 RepID=UPI001AE6637C|nr:MULTISPECIES: glutathione S-transferase family protein [unclassified Cupriavidus]MBP0623184.1 glutathione S-transferase family protein [Cupriavidus sp. LEh25]MDK2659878.1 glutathione S-transferase family protein [Cupriavidus sp. LEh21]
MILYDANAPGPNPVTVRLFVLERGGLNLDVETIDLANLENRGKTYKDEINARGEVPALRLDDGRVLTEITAICEYLDEVAKGGRSLLGETAEERALTRMWTRRVDLEIAEPITTWWRGTDDAAAFYRGHRVLMPEAQTSMRKLAEQGLDQLDRDLAGRDFICGNNVMLADILLYGFMATVGSVTPWSNPPERLNIQAWFRRMSERAAIQQAFQPFDGLVSS